MTCNVAHIALTLNLWLGKKYLNLKGFVLCQDPLEVQSGYRGGGGTGAGGGGTGAGDGDVFSFLCLLSHFGHVCPEVQRHLITPNMIVRWDI